MKRIALFIALAISSLLSNAGAGTRLSFDFFYDSLSPYGEWVSAGSYGDVWHPADVDDDWTPYSDGYWTYTDAGWTWVSYEDWGGITYHYGRWMRLDDYGWCWVPGYEWGPAWVSWRRSDDYVGWAPLPPEARWRRDTGFGVWVDTEFDIGPGYFRFCHTRDFGAPFLRPVLLPRRQNITIIQQTVNITNITYRHDHGHAFNGGPDYGWVSPRSARAVPALKLIRNTNDVFTPGNRGKVFRNAPSGNTLVVGAPPVLSGAPDRKAGGRPVARSLSNPRIDRGWAGTTDGPTRERVREKFKQETAGASPQTAPARPFQPNLVANVPKKSDRRAKLPLAAPVPQPGSVAQPPQPELSKQGEAPIAVAPAAPAAGKGRPRGSIPVEPATPAAPPVVATEPGDRTPGGKPSRIRSQSESPVVQPQPVVPGITAEPGRDAAGGKRKHSVVPQSPLPPAAEIPSISRRTPVEVVQPKPQTPPPAIAPQPGRVRRENIAPIADEQAEMAARKRNADAARAADQQRAAEGARRQQLAAEEKRNRDAAAADSARRQAEAQRAARDRARTDAVQRAAEAQRRQNESAARRAADEGRQRQMEMMRQQQQAATSAADAARRQAAAARVPAPVPPPAPVAIPPQVGRPAPANVPGVEPSGDPRKHKGKRGAPQE